MEKEIAIFGGGCFWCADAVFKELRGIVSVVSGYAGGTKENPTYEEVLSGVTGHAEVIKVEFDPSQIKYRDLLTVFFGTYDPTTLNRQGADVGTQYRSINLWVCCRMPFLLQFHNFGQNHLKISWLIFQINRKICSVILPRNSEISRRKRIRQQTPLYTNVLQRAEAEEYINALNQTLPVGKHIVIEVRPFEKFYGAEKYHQDYYKKNQSAPYCQIVIVPKMEKLEKEFNEFLRIRAKT